MVDFKLLDPNRKAVLSLPDPAFKLWATFWMFESDDHEAYPSLDRLEQVTGQSRNTILKWRKYLLETGWLLKLSGYAASRYSKPTRGSRSVEVFRVNDPTKDEKGSQREPIQGEKGSGDEPFQTDDGKGFTTFTPHEMNPRFISVSMSLSEALSESSSSPTATSADADGGCEGQSLRDLEPTQEQAKTKTPASGTGSKAALPVKLKSNSKYDAPFPYDFNSWSQVDRTRWSVEHLVAVQLPAKKEGSYPVESPKDSGPSIPSERLASPPSPAAPPEPHRFPCPYCSFAHRYRSNVADHVEAEHPKEEQLWLGPVRCPDCEWKKFYLEDTKREEYEVLLAEHIIEQHGERTDD